MMYLRVYPHTPWRYVMPWNETARARSILV